MVRPEMLAVESERAALERDAREVFDLRRLVPRIQSRDAPIFIPLLRPAQNIDQSINENMSADLGADRNLSQNVSLRIEFQDSILIPLTQIKIVAVVTEVGTSELRTRYLFVLGKSATNNVSADVSVIIRTFAERKSQCVASGDSSPRNSGRPCFFRDCPRLHIDPI